MGFHPIKSLHPNLKNQFPFCAQDGQSYEVVGRTGGLGLLDEGFGKGSRRRGGGGKGFRVWGLGLGFQHFGPDMRTLNAQAAESC